MIKKNFLKVDLLWKLIGLLIILMPFHAFLTAWFASNFGFFDAIRLWKEAILLVLILCLGYSLLTSRSLRHKFFSNNIIGASLIFVFFALLGTITGVALGSVSFKAAMYGLIIDTRSLVFLTVIVGLSSLKKLPCNFKNWLLLPAVLVIIFGLLQMFVLPDNFLRHFGYGTQTLLPFQPVDGKPELARVQSFLRGPNPLGAYLALIAIFLISYMSKVKSKKLYTLLIIASVFVMFGSYSRSGMLGLTIGLIVYLFLGLESSKAKHLSLAVLIALVSISSVITFALRNNDSFQNVVFHSNEKSPSSVSSNSARLESLENGLNDIASKPLGTGVGSAGPASVRNVGGDVRLSENYFIQIGQELGIVGLSLYLIVLWQILKQLYAKRSQVWARSALGVFAGLIVVNMVSHAWADDTLAYLSFGMIGFALIKTSTKSEKLDTL